MDHYAADAAAVVEHLDLRNAIHIGHSTGGGEATHYVARHGKGRVAKLVLIGAVPPIMVKTPANPGGLPIAVFDELRQQLAANRAQFYRDLASGPFYGYNRPGAKVSQAVIENWWRQAMMGGAKAHYDGIRAFSETDFKGRPPDSLLAPRLGHGGERGGRARPPAPEAVTPADSGAQARLDAAFARQERRGLMLAAGARSVAVLVIVVWVALTNPERGLAHTWVLGTAVLFAVTGVAQFWLYTRDLAPALAPYVFALVDSLVLAAVFVVPNPFAPAPLPPAIPLRYGNFVFFFVLLMQMAFSFRPRLLLWTGLCGAAAWTVAFLWVVTRPGVTTGTAPALDLPSGLTTYLDPNFVSVLKYEGEIIAFLVVAAGLALLVGRLRILVAERAEAERERSNLARYFSPRWWTSWPSATSRWAACAASRSGSSSPTWWASPRWPRT